MNRRTERIQSRRSKCFGVVSCAFVALGLMGCQGLDDGPVGGEPRTGRISGWVTTGSRPMTVPTVVSFSREAHVLQSYASDREGRFGFEVEPGDGRVWVIPPAGWIVDRDQENPVAVRVPAGGDVPLAVRLTAIQDSTKTDSTTVGFIQVEAREGVEPIAGILVEVTPIEGTTEAAATTGADGRVHLAVEPGTYSVSAIAPAWYEVTEILPSEVAVELDQTVSVLMSVRTIGPLPAGSLEVSVLRDSSFDENGNFEGIRVAVLRGDPPVEVASGTTDADGLVRFFDLERGDYSVEIVIPDGWIAAPAYPNPTAAHIAPAAMSRARFFLLRSP